MPESFLQDAIALREAARDFRAALQGPGVGIIAEFKRASPSKGPIRIDADAAQTTAAYERGGACALSVLTEPDFFLGGPDDVAAARRASSLPVLWKDFVLDPYQVTMARAFGADAVLVVVRIVDDVLLGSLISDIRGRAMTPVVEVFDETDVERALTAGADVVGINNRDLSTFEEDPDRTRKLRPALPDGVLAAAFSAITTRAQVEAMEAIGVDAVLAGEALMRADDPAAKVRELAGG